MEVHSKTGAARANTIPFDESSSPPSSPPLSPEPFEIDSTSPSGFVSHTTNKQNGVTNTADAPNLVFAGAAPVQVKKKPGRKRKEDIANAASGSVTAGDKPVKERKPRKPRDPNAPPNKRRKIGDDSTALKAAHAQSTVHSAAIMGSTQPTQPASYNNNPAAPPPAFAQIGKSEAEQKPNATATATVTHYGALQPPSRPSTSSGQRYDPIRSASAENALMRNSAPPTRPNMLSATPNARASPSIASLIDPPSAYAPSHHTNTSSQLSSPTNSRLPLTPSPLGLSSGTPTLSSSLTTTTNALHMAHDNLASATQSTDSQNDMNAKASKTSVIQKPAKIDSQSKTTSPKPARQKQASPPIPLGSGLLSSSTFGKSEPTQKQYAEVPNQCIVIEVPMTQETGNYVNFMREVENKYGFDVAHPRLAEHRRRMAQMAAAGAAIEADLGPVDDMPLDESEIDSNVEMGGMEDDSTAQEGMKKKKRKPRANEYDKNDGFIDDTEQLWEEQAMASSNGFFVWSGPLVPEIEKPADEKANGTVTKRGRGRGRGGSTRGETSGRGSRGGGRGSRGGATGKTRKPRMTMAERARIENEQQEREKMAVVSSKSLSALAIE